MAYYDWIKALHVISVIAWMAGIFYLPRLFVYHTGAAVGSDKSETFKVMEAKLLRTIMNPAMILTWITGLTIVRLGGWEQSGWFMAKFVLVIAMSVFHMWLASCRKAFAADRNTRSERSFRLANEIPTVLMVLIVILVVVKPF